MSVAITAAQVKELREKTGVGMMECKQALTENQGDMEKAIRWLRERGMARAAKKADRVASEGTVEVYVNEDLNAGILLEVNCETDFVSKNEDFRKFVHETAVVALKGSIEDLDRLSESKLPSGDTVAATLTALIAKIGENMKLRRIKIVASKNGTVVGYSHMGGRIGTLVALDGAKNPSIQELGKDLAMRVAAAFPRFLKPEDVEASELEVEKDLARKKLQQENKPDHLIEKIMQGQINKFYKEVCLVEQAFIKDPNQTVKGLVQSKGVQLASFARFQMGEGIEKKQENFAEEVAAATKGLN